MLATRIPSSAAVARIASQRLLASSAAHISQQGTAAFRAVVLVPHALQQQQSRPLSFTSAYSLKSTPANNLQLSSNAKEMYTEPAWPHPVYTKEEMDSIRIAHREAKNWSDYTALGLVRLLRFGFDLATGYKHDKEIATGAKPAESALSGSSPATQKFAMDERKWLIRAIFLESIAGVPGMVGGMVRHLHSLRKLQRDNGWIETLLEEAYNERMHLLTFLKMAQPGWFMRLMILGGQGVFFNAFFLGYLLSPRTAHRFVGYIEEEAVITYTRMLADMNAGKLPLWKNMVAPEIARQYWKMGDKATVEDMLYYIRADEAKHREVNHTLANLAQGKDPNPFTVTYEDQTAEHPTTGIAKRPIGWERDECIKSEVKTEV